MARTNRNMRGIVVAIISGALSTGCSVFGIRTTEEPPYSVLRTAGPVEIRSYGPRVAAETVVPGDEMEARSTGFQRLAGYIFGGNSAKQSIAMTAPVAQSSGGANIDMTAPVDQARTETGAWRIRFFMPATYAITALPQPNDPAVRLVTAPPETVAVLRYAGVPSADAVAKANGRLLEAVRGAGLQPEGAPFSWFYDPPWTLPPLRRNEAVVRLRSIQ